MSHGGDDGENAERWLLTYADMITLLMAFFLMLYSMSIMNMDKFTQLALSVRSGFGGDVAETMGGPALGVGGFSVAMPAEMPANSFELMSKISEDIRGELAVGDVGDVEVLAEGDTVTVRIRADDVLFARGSAALTPHARAILHPVAHAIAPLPQDIRVEGHTCDIPIHNARFASNWELSATRATTVVLCLIREYGANPGRLSAIGYADTRPVHPNDTEHNRARNRRIDLVLTHSTRRPASQSLDQLPKPPDVNIKPGPVSLSGNEGAPLGQGEPPAGESLPAQGVHAQ